MLGRTKHERGCLGFINFLKIKDYKLHERIVYFSVAIDIDFYEILTLNLN